MNPEPGRILVVDDNEMNRDLLVRRLKRQKHVVETAENGRLALDKIQQTAYDLILLDIMMPVMNGYQVLETLKSDPDLRHIPVIVISAANETESVIKCISLGAEDYLPKPYDPLLLKARIGACLEKKRLRDQEQQHMAEMAVMQQIDQQLNATLDLNRAMEIMLDWALRHTNQTVGLMGIIEEGHLQVITARGYSYEISPDNPLILLDELPAVTAALQSSCTEMIPNSNGAGLLAKVVSQTAVPVLREDEVIAVLLIESNEPSELSPSTISFLDRLSNHAAIAIANAQMYEAVQAANLAKTEFVSFVSHELKIPMTSIKGYADMLLTAGFGELNETQYAFLKTIRSNVDRMALLVSDLADVSRIESGHLQLQSQQVSLSEIAQDVVDATRNQIDAKSQQLSVHIPDNLPPVWGDRARLTQILTNLVSNAYKYTPEEGKISIRAMTMAYANGVPAAQNMVQVSVEDTGLGIREEDQENIFGKFYRADDPEAIKAPGTGLGLNITKNLVELHDGQIWFESTFRQGTTFHFAIPAAT